nr:MAG TPA: hypothetical protein [Caudoviricetes sp.]
MKAMTNHMVDYCDKAGIAYSADDTRFRIIVLGEEYTIRRSGLRHWECMRNGVTTVFKSQWEVIAWIDSRW